MNEYLKDAIDQYAQHCVEDMDVDDLMNRKTKDHRVVKSNGTVCEKEWFADSDGWWIAWEGGECPLSDGEPFEIRRRDGDIVSDVLVANWVHYGIPSDIIAYRPILTEPSEPEAEEWDGEGLPPVGCGCDCYHKGTYQGVVTVRYMGSEMCVLLNHNCGEEQCGPIDAYSFLPIRTPAQRAEDEVVKEMLAVAKGGGSPSFTASEKMMRRLYRAGYRYQAD